MRVALVFPPQGHFTQPYLSLPSLAAFLRANGIEDNLKFELRHKAIIDRLGRYPHRNAVLGRESTAEEITFLTEPGSSF